MAQQEPEVMPLAVLLMMKRMQQAIIARANKELAYIDSEIQKQCQHAFKLNQVAGTGQTCTKCGLWDLNCDD